MERETRQRRAIRRVFEETARPLTPEEVVEHGQRHVPSLGIATVYRNLRRLADEGWLSEVEIPGSGVRFELAEQPHHHHFVCRGCERVFDIEGCPPRVETLAPDGFTVETHEVILYGRCERCAPGAG